MKELITLHVGQAGIQEGLTLWEQFRGEHNISKDGIMRSRAGDSGFSSVFFQNSLGKCIPRALMIDTDPDPIARVRRYGGTLFSPNHFLHSPVETGSCFARGYVNQPRRFIEDITDTIRKELEHCDSFQGILVLNSLSGGTGSGLGALIMNKLFQEYTRKNRFQFSIFPSPKTSSVIVAPYNACFYNSYTCDDLNNLVFLADNQAMGNILERKLNTRDISLWTINELVAQVVSQLTICHRSPASFESTLQDMKINLIPFPSLRFISLSYSPILTSSTWAFSDMNAADITRECFEPCNNMVSCDIRKGKFISCCMMYRGDAEIRDINTAVRSVIGTGRVPYVSWVPLSVKVGIGWMPPYSRANSKILVGTRSGMLLMNTTSIQELWHRQLSNFNRMYSKKAFVHWYLQEGMELDDFLSTKESNARMLEGYSERNL